MSDQITETEPRRKWLLETIIGAVRARSVRGGLQEMTSELDSAGVARKAAMPMDSSDPSEGDQMVEDTDTPETVSDEQGEMLAKLANKTAADLMTSLKDDWQSMTEEKLQAAMLSSWGVNPATDENAPPIENEETEMTEDKQKKPTQAAPDLDMQKAFTESFGSMVKDMQQIAASVQTMTDQAAKSSELQKTLAEGMTAIMKRLESLEEKVNSRPRIASQAGETMIDPTSEAARALQSAIEKGMNGEHQTFMGIAVKTQPK